MTSIENLIPQTPLEVGIPFAQRLVFHRDFDDFNNTDFETSTIFEMNATLQQFEMVGVDYDLSTHMAFLLPEDLEPDDNGDVYGWEWHGGTQLNGELIGGRTLKIGRKIGEKSIRAVCLTFQDAFVKYRANSDHGIIPIFETIDEKDRVYVPIFAINEIEQTL